MTRTRTLAQFVLQLLRSSCFLFVVLSTLLSPYAPVASAITRGSNDDNSTQAAAVVLIQSQNNRCTGTLISPVAVLTAKHCITGDNFSGQNIFGGLGGEPAAVPPFMISVGNPIGNGTTAVATYFSDPAKPFSVYGDNGPVNDQEHGSDIAIIWLDPNNPAVSFAKIVRPTLASPVPADGDDSEGGTYKVPVGVSGWSAISNHDPSFRQVAFYDAVYHYPGYPGGGPGTPSGQYWVHAQGAGNIEPGDSGGPLFWRDVDGTRFVIGVAGSTFHAPFAIDGFDCTLNMCDMWTDVTRGAIALWIRQQMLDTSKSPAWLLKHGKSDQWRGEVDYTGPCNKLIDEDCDHWTNDHDYCWNYYNPNQREDDACRLAYLIPPNNVSLPNGAGGCGATGCGQTGKPHRILIN